MTHLLLASLHGLLLLGCLLLALPAAVLLIEMLLALLPGRAGALPAGARPRVTVLVPAHDESTGLLPTLGQACIQL